MKLASATLVSLLVAAPSLAARHRLPEPDPSLATNAVVGNVIFINKGLVGFGVIPAYLRDSFGETIGGISAIALKRGSFQGLAGNKFGGTFLLQPDRGYDLNGTVDYQARYHSFDFVLNPYYATAPLPFTSAVNTLQLSYKSTVKYTERGNRRTTGLDPRAARPRNRQLHDPVFPIDNLRRNHLALDDQGLVVTANGSIWVADQNGPYIYKFDSTGHLLTTITPPLAVLPMIGGDLDFTTLTNPDTGRAAGAGFSGLATDPAGFWLFAVLRTATVQDGGGSPTTSRNKRLFKWDITGATPKLLNEWVVSLPVSNAGVTIATDDLHYMNVRQMLLISGDHNGLGAANPLSAYKSIDIIDIGGSTDIHGTQFDALVPISPNGVLSNQIIPAFYRSFVNLLDPIQLTRFGLHNGAPIGVTQLDAKFESLALAPVNDPRYPDDYFLFTFSDNDFITTTGHIAGASYSAAYGRDVPTQALVYRVTLPTVREGSVEESIGI